MRKHSLKAQRARLLERLQQKPCTTLEARHELDILGVAPRVYELRHYHSFNIKKEWTSDYNPGGGRHRIARYILMPGKFQGGN